MALLASQVCASADTISEYSTEVNQNAFVDGTLTLALPDFDPSLGTLTGAALTLEGITGPQFEVLNVGTNGVAGTGIGSTSVTYTVTGTGVSGLSGSASSGTQTVTVTSGFFDLASSTPVLTVIDSTVALTELSGLMGSGTVDFNIGELFTSSGSTNTVGASLAFGGTASANLGLALVYTYDPVPEPMSLALLGTGLAGLSALRRRRARV